jgi:hypothetical protein
MTVPIRDEAVVRGVRRSLYVLALVMSCVSCGDDRSRSARGNTADRERVAKMLGARLAQQLASSPNGLVSLRDVVASHALVGRRVRVVGHCSSPLRIPERPRRSGATWQLESDGVTVLVVGTVPQVCEARRQAVLTLTAIVAEDTLAAIGDLPGAPRRYLLLVDAR